MSQTTVTLTAAFHLLSQVTAEHEAFLKTLPPRSYPNQKNQPKETLIHHNSRDYYQYIPLLTRSFLNGVCPSLHNAKSFLDVGCGMGDKLRLIAKIAPDLHIGGIEFHKPYADAAQKVAPTAAIIHMDALQYDGYRSWDVIYAYVPISNYELMQKLTDRILRKMRRGSTFILFGSGDKRGKLKRDDERGCYLYRKS
jgi:tRNA G46 methylase TrmB